MRRCPARVNAGMVGSTVTPAAPPRRSTAPAPGDRTGNINSDSIPASVVQPGRSSTPRSPRRHRGLLHCRRSDRNHLRTLRGTRRRLLGPARHQPPRWRRSPTGVAGGCTSFLPTSGFSGFSGGHRVRVVGCDPASRYRECRLPCTASLCTVRYLPGRVSAGPGILWCGVQRVRPRRGGVVEWIR